MMCRSTNIGGQRRSSRRGSAIILSIIAIAIVSMASITVVRSHRRMNFKRSSTKLRSEGRLIAAGLVHREVAFSRQSPKSGQAPVDAGLKLFPNFDEAQAKVSGSAPEITVEVYLYPGAPVATTRRQLDVSTK